MNFKFKTLALTIGLATGSISLPTFAMPITVNVSSSVVANAHGIIRSDSDGPATAVNSNAQANYYYSNSWAGGRANGQASGSDAGNSYTQAYSGGDIATTSSNVHQVATITNDSLIAQHLTFDFSVDRTFLRTALVGYELPTSGYATADYSINILLNNISLWSSTANLRLDATGSTLSKSGTELNSQTYGDSFGHGSEYNWSGFSGLLDLGVLNAGSSFTLEYFMSATAETNLIPEEADSGYGAYVSIGDPFSFNAIDNNNIHATAAQPSTPLPEPAGIALLGAGLLGLAYRRRAKKSV